jgi:hypothetical protein
VNKAFVYITDFTASLTQHTNWAMGKKPLFHSSQELTCKLNAIAFDQLLFDAETRSELPS